MQEVINQQEEVQGAINQNNIMSLKQIVSLQRKVRKNKKVLIDLSGTRYNVIWNVMEKGFQWECSESPCDEWNLMWNDTYITDEDLRKMLPFQKINHFPGSHYIGRKNELGKNLRSMKKIHQEDFDFFPKTWLLPYQGEELRQHHLKHKTSKPVYIIKPEASCQGRGIYLSKKIDQLIVGDNRFVVQQYLKNPFLLDGLKFDLRIYVLVKSVSPLRIFMYREGLGRFATQSYASPSKKNLNNMCMHLTNYAVNKRSKDFVFNSGDDTVGHKRSLSAVLNTLKNMGHDTNKIQLDIRQVLVKTLCSVQPYLAHIYRSCQPRDDQNEQCFELFGFDVMLDETLKPWLIEVNHTPSFSTDTQLDLQIKRSLITDTLILINVKNKQKKQYYESKRAQNFQKHIKKTLEERKEYQRKIDNFENANLNGFLKIFPADDDPINYEAYMETAQQLLDEWAGTVKQPLKKIIEPESVNFPSKHTLQKQIIQSQPSQRKTSMPQKEMIKRPQSSLNTQSFAAQPRPLSTNTRTKNAVSQRNKLSLLLPQEQEQINLSESELEVDAPSDKSADIFQINRALDIIQPVQVQQDNIKGSLPPKPMSANYARNGLIKGPPLRREQFQASQSYSQQIKGNQIFEMRNKQNHYQNGIEQIQQLTFQQNVERNGYNTKLPNSLSHKQFKVKNDVLFSKQSKQIQQRRKQEEVPSTNKNIKLDAMVPIKNFNFQDKLTNLLNLQKE